MSSDSVSSDYDSDSDHFSDGCGSYDNLKPTAVLKLEKMASVRVAITVWNRATDGVAIPGMVTNHDEWCASFRDEVPKWIAELPIPKSLATNVTNHFIKVKSNVIDWISYIFRTVFFYEGIRSDLYQHVDHITWHLNGTINSLETARKLIKSDRLTDMEKFCLACTYCLREEVERMWPLMENNNQVHEIRFSRYPLIYYWKCYCTGKLEKIPARSYLPVDEFMIQRPSVDNWPAIEYFFDRSNADRRILITILLIDKLGAGFQKLLLLKLNESQRLHVTMDRLSNIMANYAYWGHNEDIITTWHCVHDLITEDQFVALFDELFDSSAEDFVLAEIWNTARDEFKRHILNYSDDNFIAKLFKWCECKRDNCFDFVSAVLLDPVSVDIKREITKKKFFNEWCKKFICKNAVELLNHLINLCFPGAAESTKFKLSLVNTSCFNKQCKTLIINHNKDNIETLAKFLDFASSSTDPSSDQFARKFLSAHLKILDRRCFIYYSAGNLRGLNDLLAPLASLYPEIISEYKSKLLMSRAGFKGCINHFGSMDDVLVEIIGDGLPVELGTEFKKRIIFSYEGIYKLKNMIVDGPLSHAEKCARRFLESDTDRKILRTLLIDRMNGEKCEVHTKTRKKFMEFLL